MKTCRRFDEAVESMVRAAVLKRTDPEFVTIPACEIHALALAYGLDTFEAYHIISAEVRLMLNPTKEVTWQQ